MINLDSLVLVEGIRPQDISGADKVDSTYPIVINANSIMMITGGGYDHIEGGSTIHFKDGSKVYVDESPECLQATILSTYECQRSSEFERLYDEEKYRNDED